MCPKCAPIRGELLLFLEVFLGGNLINAIMNPELILNYPNIIKTKHVLEIVFNFRIVNSADNRMSIICRFLQTGLYFKISSLAISPEWPLLCN